MVGLRSPEAPISINNFARNKVSPLYHEMHLPPAADRLDCCEAQEAAQKSFYPVTKLAALRLRSWHPSGASSMSKE